MKSAFFKLFHIIIVFAIFSQESNKIFRNTCKRNPGQTPKLKKKLLSHRIFQILRQIANFRLQKLSEI